MGSIFIIFVPRESQLPDKVVINGHIIDKDKFSKCTSAFFRMKGNMADGDFYISVRI